MKNCIVCNKLHKNDCFCSKTCKKSELGKKLIQDKIKQTNLEKYGVEYPLRRKDIRDKAKQTNLEKYGCENPFGNKEIQNKIKQTNLEKYGTEQIFKSEKIQQKIKEKNLKNFGCENPINSPEIRKKIKQTNLEKYGGETPFHNRDIQNKVTRIIFEKYGDKCYLNTREGIEKKEKTCIKKYGVDHPMKNKSVKNKIRQTNLKKYGGHPLTSEKVKNKLQQTNLERHGNVQVLNCPVIRDKIKQTNLERYGVNSTLGITFVKNKIRQTNLKKYGAENPFANENVKEKIRQTNLKKYGVENIMFLNETHEKINQKLFRTYYHEKLLHLKIVSPLFSAEEYRGNKHGYTWRCLKCNEIFNGFMSNGNIPRCLKCFPILSGTSHLEQELQEWIEQYIQIERNKRFFENGKYKYELDIFIPSKNIGIEFNGLYHHSEIGGHKSSIYHLEKSEYFLNKNIQVIHIFENEWIQKQEIIKSIILSKLNLLPSIFAHECEIKSISPQKAKEFFENNCISKFFQHIKNSFGLYHKEDLISVLALRNDKNLKYCNKINNNVVGGFNKLLTWFIETYTPKILISNVDRRFFTGGLFLKNKFELVNILEPNYWYTKYKYLESNIFYQKHRLKKILPIFDPKLTEWENMQINGYDRIWDCGNLVFELKN